MMSLAEAIEQLEALQDEYERSQLVTYAKNVSLSKIDSSADHRQLIGYERANTLDTKTLRELKEEDDWGVAWETHDGEDNEYHYSDEGAMEALGRALTILREGLTRP